jgi:hypothetical protein
MQDGKGPGHRVLVSNLSDEGIKLIRIVSKS